jgi:N-acetylmuramoyl-L-alanine amidase
VLVEIGYLTHDGDVRRLASSKYLERLADGITLGVVEYKNKLARFNR